MISPRRPASLKITPVELYNRLQVMGGLLLIDTRPKRRRRRTTTTSRKSSLEFDTPSARNLAAKMMNSAENQTSIGQQSATGSIISKTLTNALGNETPSQSLKCLGQSTSTGNSLNSDAFEGKEKQSTSSTSTSISTNTSDITSISLSAAAFAASPSSSTLTFSSTAATSSTFNFVTLKDKGKTSDSTSSLSSTDSYIPERKASLSHNGAEIIRSSICIPSRGVFTPEHTLADKINLITESLTQADAALFLRRKLVQVVIYSDEGPHHWMLDLRDILLEEGAVLSVAILDAPFSSFQRLYPFMCVPVVTDDEAINKYHGLFKIYPNEIEPGLFLGNRRQALDEEIMLRQLSFTHVVDLHDADISAALTFQSQGIKYFTLAIWDREDADFGGAFERIYEFVENARASAIYHYQGVSRKTKILFHCNQGISRSASCIIYYMMRKHRIPLTKAFQIVQNARDCVYPNSAFMRQLLQEEQKLFGTQSDVSLLSVTYEKDLRSLYLGKPEPYRCALM